MVTSGPFLFLSKLLPELLLPLGVTFLLLIAALAFGTTRRRQRVLVGGALLLLGVGSSGCVSELLVRSLERRYPAPLLFANPNFLRLIQLDLQIAGGQDICSEIQC